MKILIAALSMAGISAGHAFLLEDGSFDKPIASLSDGKGWEGFGTPDTGAAVSREDWANGAGGTGGFYGQQGDGQYGIAFKAFSASAGGIYHDVPVAPGTEYEFFIQSHTAANFFNQVVTGGTGTVTISFQWFDGDPESGGSLVTENVNDITNLLTDGGSDTENPIGPSRPDRWQNWDYDFIAPAGAAVLRVRIAWTAAANVTGGDEAMRWDNAELTTALDPVGDSSGEGDVVHLSYTTQEGVTYDLEASADLAMFASAGLPPRIGDDTQAEVFIVPAADHQFYRLRSTPNLLDGRVFVTPSDITEGDEGWQGFMNVSELPENGGAYVFGSGWGIDDLVSTISSTALGGDSTFCLSPNTIGDPNEFWYQNTTGMAADPANPGGPGQAGNKIMEANLFVTNTDSPLSGNLVTFSGTVLSNTLTASHTAKAFIKDFSPGFGEVTEESVPLTPGPFSVSLATQAGAGRHVQYGFAVTGVNVWVTDVAPFGKVELATATFPLEEVGLMIERTSSTVISWDGQLGVHYLVEYSDDGGTIWQAFGFGSLVGTGASMQVADPEGTVPGRQYRVVAQAFVPRLPAP